GYVILNALKNALATRMNVSVVAMSVALATGLYATHTFVPPTPGPIAAAGNLGLGSQLGLVIAVGLLVSAVTALAGPWWDCRLPHADRGLEALRASYGVRPGAGRASAPLLVPVLLLCLGSLAACATRPLGEGLAATVLGFFGQPVVAPLVGLAFACLLLKG